METYSTVREKMEHEVAASNAWKEITNTNQHNKLRYRIAEGKSVDLLTKWANYSTALTLWVTLTFKPTTRKMFRINSPSGAGLIGQQYVEEPAYTTFLKKLNLFYASAIMVSSAGILVTEVGDVNGRRHAHALLKVQRRHMQPMGQLLEKWQTWNGFVKSEPIFSNTIADRTLRYCSKYLYKAYTDDLEADFGGIPPIFEW